MSHNTVFGGVSREIEGGTPLIGGVSREIESGLVLVGGVAREIEFGGKECTITIAGTGDSRYVYATIEGTKYYTASSVVVPAGTTISLYASCNRNTNNNTISLNGTTLVTSSIATHDYMVTTNVKITLSYISSSYYAQGSIAVVEE